jgi:hypothetical protein
VAAGAVAVRARGGQDLGVMSLDAFVQKIQGTLPTSLVFLVEFARVHCAEIATVFVAGL